MELLKVGEVFAPLAGREEGVIFEAYGDGYILAYNFNNPTAEEIKAVSSQQSFEIRALRMKEVIWILSKCGSLAWADAPYSPHLSTLDGLIRPIGEGLGTSLLLLMLDARTGIIKNLRLIGLGHKFSLELFDEIGETLKEPFDINEQRANITATMMAYSTRALADRAGIRYRLKSSS